MTEKAAIDDEVVSHPKAPAGPARNHAVDFSDLADRWFCDHTALIALGIVIAGLGIRLWVASRTYLNPDEALHYYLINQPSVLLAYKASLTNAHPPLLFLILYFWHFVGRSELMLRLPSVMAGGAFCWLTFKWVAVFFGRAAALIALALVTFSPAMIALSAEVREYALLLSCMAAALYFLGRAIQERSPGKMWYFSAFLYLAVLSHYSAAFFVLAVGVYALVRIAGSSQRRGVVAAWVLGQLGALAIYAFLYWTHVVEKKNVIALWAAPFDRFYFRLGERSFADLFDFLSENTTAIFRYMFGEARTSQAVFLLFIAGTVYLFARGLRPPRGTQPSCHLGIFVTIPFFAAWGASMTAIYPYVGSRHTIFLAPFSIAAVSSLLAAITRHKLWAGLLVAGTLLGFANSADQFLGGKQRGLMTAAMAEISQSIPGNEFILVDYQTDSSVAYYLCGPRQIVPLNVLPDGFYRFECGGHQFVSLDYHFWKLTPKNFSLNAPKMARDFGLRAGDRFWVFQAGWGDTLDNQLRGHQPEFRCLASKDFGSALAVIPFVLDANLLPASPNQNCDLQGSPQPSR